MKLQSIHYRTTLVTAFVVLALSWAGAAHSLHGQVFDLADDFSDGDAGGTNPSALGWSYASDQHDPADPEQQDRADPE